MNQSDSKFDTSLFHDEYSPNNEGSAEARQNRKELRERIRMMELDFVAFFQLMPQEEITAMTTQMMNLLLPETVRMTRVGIDKGSPCVI